MLRGTARKPSELAVRPRRLRAGLAFFRLAFRFANKKLGLSFSFYDERNAEGQDPKERRSTEARMRDPKARTAEHGPTCQCSLRFTFSTLRAFDGSTPQCFNARAAEPQSLFQFALELREP